MMLILDHQPIVQKSMTIVLFVSIVWEALKQGICRVVMLCTNFVGRSIVNILLQDVLSVTDPLIE